MQRQNKEYAMSQKSEDKPKKPVTADAMQLADELQTVIENLIDDESLENKGNIDDSHAMSLYDEVNEAFDTIALTLKTLEGEQDE